mmetsp:Transcript_6267/g.20425  ORF Transcript_6267/g.20425 Transcript_6267/m.20425 type:complete len:401 (-) Transcript_6267:216-1418(-)
MSVSTAAALTQEQADVRKREIEALLFGGLEDALASSSSVTTRKEEESQDSSHAEAEAEAKEEDSDRLNRFSATRLSKRRSLSRRRSSSLQPMSSDRAEAMRREIAADRDELSHKSTRTGDVDLAEAFVKSKSKTVVVCGASGTGKTQIVETFAKGSTRLKPNATMGVEKYDVDDLTVWDTSGDERFDKATAGLLKVADAVVAVYDPTRPETLALARSRLGVPGPGALVASYRNREERNDDEEDLSPRAYDDASPAGGAGAGVDDDQQPELARSGQQLADQLQADFFFLKDPTDKQAVDALFDAVQRRLGKTTENTSPTTKKNDNKLQDDNRGKGQGEEEGGEPQEEAASKAKAAHLDPALVAAGHLSDHPDLLDSLQSDLVAFFAAFVLLATFAWLWIGD